MKLTEAIVKCHVRSAVYRESNPSIKYWKNDRQTIFERVPKSDRKATDWKEYDPADEDNNARDW